MLNKPIFNFSGFRHFLAVSLLVLLAACSAATPRQAATNNTEEINRISAVFGPDGRLWRVLADDWHVYVDYSEDLGKTFSQPVTVNLESQRIRGNFEDRAHIAVNNQGNVYVIYQADAKLPWTAFFSASTNGLQFSKPVPVSDQADTGKHGLANLAVDRTGAAFLVWHDNRQQTQRSEAGLYWAQGQSNGNIGISRKAGDYECECCRIALAIEPSGAVALFTRQVYPTHIRDHGVFRQTLEGQWQSWRSTDDGWEIEACPEQGPALAVAENGRYHMAWFTQGSKRSGLFYAYSDDNGRHLSQTKRLGDELRLPGHPRLLAMGNHVAMVWREFDGRQSYQIMVFSKDNGATWTEPKIVATSGGDVDEAQLLSNKQQIFLSWYTQKEGYRLIPLL